MRRLPTLILLLLASIIAYNADAQQKPDTLRRKDGNGWEFIQVRSYNLVTVEGKLHNGVANGVWTEYWSSTYPKTVITYVNGKKDGIAMGVNIAGAVEYVEQYKNGLLDGPRKVYNTDTKLLEEEAMYSEGKKHGYYTKWFSNGKTQQTGKFVNDMQDGNAVWYYENGNKAVEYNYTNGVIDGEGASYYNDGTIKEHGTYAKNIQQGPWKEYYENGPIKAEGNYVKGERDGPWKEYDKEGKYTKTVKYNKGVAK